jgi:2-polyprenyl-6-hydroxyphenyl methylase / 3-demethylubiquinone-9 3-methyltransferase
MICWYIQIFFDGKRDCLRKLVDICSLEEFPIKRLGLVDYFSANQNTMNLWIFGLASLMVIYFFIPPKEHPNRLVKIEKTNIDNSYYDLEKFSKTWNDPNSWFQGLHVINPTRLNYILNILKKHNVKTSAVILDVGCGGGILTNEISQNNFENVKGIDISKNSILEAIRVSKEKNLKTKFEVGSAYKIPQENNSVDVVILTDILEHLDDLPSMMKEVDRILKKGGLIFFETIDRNIYSNTMVKVLGETFGVIPKNTHDYKLFIKPQELNQLFDQFNFQFIEYFGYDFKIGFAKGYFPTIVSSSLLEKGVLRDLYIGYGVKK